DLGTIGPRRRGLPLDGADPAPASRAPTAALGFVLISPSVPVGLVRARSRRSRAGHPPPAPVSPGSAAVGSAARRATTHVHPFHRTPQREFCLSGMELPVCRENPYRGPAGSGTFPLGRRHEGARMDGRGSGAKSRAGSFAYAVDEDGA